jgi:hypothetical protein
MSRRRERSQRDKLTAQEMRDLIKEYGIEFRGPLTPSQWPELTLAADRERRGLVNEDTLRGNTEHIVFKRFGSYVKW